jgi:hypothetical protein
MGVETHGDTGEAHVTRVPSVDAAPRRRRRWRYVPRRIDNRTRTARRAKALREHFTAALVGSGRELTVDLTERVMKASELTALAEDMRAKMLRGEADVCADDLVRVTRLADASVRRLNLPPSAASKPTPTLADIIGGEVP